MWSILVVQKKLTTNTVKWTEIYIHQVLLYKIRKHLRLNIKYLYYHLVASTVFTENNDKDTQIQKRQSSLHTIWKYMM